MLDLGKDHVDIWNYDRNYYWSIDDVYHVYISLKITIHMVISVHIILIYSATLQTYFVVIFLLQCFPV